jgi:transcriptional regulator with XRE-family HTH domain
VAAPVAIWQGFGSAGFLSPSPAGTQHPPAPRISIHKQLRDHIVNLGARIVPADRIVSSRRRDVRFMPIAPPSRIEVTMTTKQPSLVTQVGSRMRAIRTARGLTQAEVAERAGCDPQTIQRAESGKFGLSLSRLESVALGLGVVVGELFADAGSPVPSAPWSADDARAAAIWHRLPAERRALALRVLQQFADD